MANQKLVVAIQQEFEQSRRTYGAPRIHAALKAGNVYCNRKRVALLLKSVGIAARRKRRHTITTTSSHNLPVAPNILQQQFVAERPNQKWLADITYVATREGWSGALWALAGVLDVYSRRIVGWAMDKTMGQELVARALEMALVGRKPAGDLLHHCDWGSQYAAKSYQQCLREHGITISMSRRANCYDNAAMESFWSSLKTECATEVFSSRASARQQIFEYIEIWYNRARRHSALGYLNPATFEQLNQRAL